MARALRASELTQENNSQSILSSQGVIKNSPEKTPELEGDLAKSIELGDSRMKNAVAEEEQQEKRKANDNFVSDVKTDKDNYLQYRSDSIRSQQGDVSRNSSQVFQVSDFNKILNDAASPDLKSKRRSRFHPAEKEREEEKSPMPQFRFIKFEQSIVAPTSGQLKKTTSSFVQEQRPLSPSKNWKKVSLVVRSVIYMKHEKVRNIGTPDEMFDEMEDYKPAKVRNLYAEGASKNLATDNFIQDALEAIRRTEILCDCATHGSEKHIKLMHKILQEDPRKNILSKADANHILNKHNKFGQNALYLAAKFGNINAVRFLLEQQSDPNVKSYVSKESKLTEKCLHAAARWGNIEIVALLLQQVDFSKEDLKQAIKQTDRKDVKKILIDTYRNKFGGLGCLFRFFSV